MKLSCLLVLLGFKFLVQSLVLPCFPQFLLPYHQLHPHHLCFSPQLPSLTNHLPSVFSLQVLSWSVPDPHHHPHHVTATHVQSGLVTWFLFSRSQVFVLPSFFPQFRFVYSVLFYFLNISSVFVGSICIRVLPPPRHASPPPNVTETFSKIADIGKFVFSFKMQLFWLTDLHFMNQMSPYNKTLNCSIDSNTKCQQLGNRSMFYVTEMEISHRSAVQCQQWLNCENPGYSF